MRGGRLVLASGSPRRRELLGAAGLVVVDVSQVLAPAPDAMHLLGGIDHLKVGREAADDLQCFFGVEVLDQFGQLFAGPFIFFTAAN